MRGVIRPERDPSSRMTFMRIRYNFLGIRDRTLNFILCKFQNRNSKYSFYRPQRSCGQGNIFTGVCLSTGGGCVLSPRGYLVWGVYLVLRGVWSGGGGVVLGGVWFWGVWLGGVVWGWSTGVRGGCGLGVVHRGLGGGVVWQGGGPRGGVTPKIYFLIFF